LLFAGSPKALPLKTHRFSMILAESVEIGSAAEPAKL